MTLTSGDRETIHLFTVDLPEDDLWTFVTADPDSGAFPLRSALGVETLDETQVEGAVIDDLVGIGLAGFLTEGIGVDEGLIARDRTRIDALTGSVVIVKGAAFDGAGVTLTPQPPLTHIGTWQMTAAASTMEPLDSAAARGSVPPPPAPAPKPEPRRRKSIPWIIAGVLLLILLTVVVGAVL
ncbi:hypothetical protein [Pseudooceanicola sp.]|uniref:hypothetical protein n=1 Tax=Pseudooceanicola sp. TaxID=1914328 RepID=UPI0035C69BF6